MSTSVAATAASSRSVSPASSAIYSPAPPPSPVTAPAPAVSSSKCAFLVHFYSKSLKRDVHYVEHGRRPFNKCRVHHCPNRSPIFTPPHADLLQRRPRLALKWDLEEIPFTWELDAVRPPRIRYSERLAIFRRQRDEALKGHPTIGTFDFESPLPPHEVVRLPIIDTPAPTPAQLHFMRPCWTHPHFYSFKLWERVYVTEVDASPNGKGVLFFRCPNDREECENENAYRQPDALLMSSPYFKYWINKLQLVPYCANPSPNIPWVL